MTVRQVSCARCDEPFETTRKNGRNCPPCVKLNAASATERPATITCEVCQAVVPTNPVGKISRRCSEHRKQVTPSPIVDCSYCGVKMRWNRRRTYPHCQTCRETGVATRDRWLRDKYGITLWQYEKLWSLQGGRCAICRGVVKKLSSKTPGAVGIACTDHDHVTGRVRGILCHHCNRSLGTFGDNLEGIMRVVEYLRNPPMDITDKMA